MKSLNNLQTIKDLVSIASFDTTNNTRIIEYLIKRFDKAKEIIKIKEPNTSKYSLIIGLNTYVKNCSCILLSGHIDTVNLKNNNLNPVLKDGKLSGLGVIDMKCFFASIIDNFEFLQSLKMPIIVAITCDEETSLNSIGRVVQKLKSRGVTAKFAILGEPTDLKICTQAKCCNEYKVVVKGKGCHSSNPSNGINAVYIAAKIANFIEQLNEKYENTTLNVGAISGGKAANIVPNACEMIFDLRSINYKDEALQEVIDYIEKVKQCYPGSKIKLENSLAIPGFYQEENAFIQTLKKKLKIKIAPFKAGCEAGYLQPLSENIIVFGAGKLSLAHKENEYLDIDKYAKYNNLLLKMLQIIENY